MNNYAETRYTIKNRARSLCHEQGRAMMRLALTLQLFTQWMVFFLRTVEENPLILLQKYFTDQVEPLMQDPAALTSLDPTPAYTNTFAYGRELFAQEGTVQLVFAYVMLFLCSIILQYGFFSCCLRRMRDEEVRPDGLFTFYLMPTRVLLLELAVTVLVCVGLSFFLLPGIFLYYALSLASFALVDHPEESALTALRRSFALTKGHKLELFFCDVSFLGWVVLQMLAGDAAASVGSMIHPMAGNVLYLAGSTAVACFLMPYRYMTLAGYYDRYKSQQ